jgi:hypothetical protein
MEKTRGADRGQGTSASARAGKRPRWTKDEIVILKRLYRTHSNAEIAKVLGRTVSSVVFKGYRLGLSKGVRRLREMGRENVGKRWSSKSRARSRRRRPRVHKK